MGNLIYEILSLAYHAINLIILARVIISWIPGIDVYKEPVKTIVKLADIILEPIRDLLDRFGLLTMIDISPIIAFFLIRAIYRILLVVLVF